MISHKGHKSTKTVVNVTELKNRHKMIYATLWSILSAINNAEKEACTLQIVRPFVNYSGGEWRYENLKEDKLTDFCVNVMTKYSIPIISVDLVRKTEDVLMEVGSNNNGIFLAYLYVHTITIYSVCRI